MPRDFEKLAPPDTVERLLEYQRKGIPLLPFQKDFLREKGHFADSTNVKRS